MSTGGGNRYGGPQPIPLAAQAGILRSRFPDSEVALTKASLRWRGKLTPSEYSDTYEVVVDHSLEEKPLIYVVRPRLERVEGKRLPHVFAWNTLCLHTEKRLQITGERLADTIIPWTAEWLFFYEVWLATRGEWMGGGVHGNGSSKPLTEVEKSRYAAEREKRYSRLNEALRAFYDFDQIDEALYNAHL